MKKPFHCFGLPLFNNCVNDLFPSDRFKIEKKKSDSW